MPQFGVGADEDIVLRGMGSFHVGAASSRSKAKSVRMIVRQPGGPQTKLDPNGQYMVEQMYVQYSCRRTRRASSRCCCGTAAG